MTTAGAVALNCRNADFGREVILRRFLAVMDIRTMPET